MMWDYHIRSSNMMSQQLLLAVQGIQSSIHALNQNQIQKEDLERPKGQLVQSIMFCVESELSNQVHMRLGILKPYHISVRD